MQEIAGTFFAIVMLGSAVKYIFTPEDPYARKNKYR